MESTLLSLVQEAWCHAPGSIVAASHQINVRKRAAVAGNIPDLESTTTKATHLDFIRTSPCSLPNLSAIPRQDLHRRHLASLSLPRGRRGQIRGVGCSMPRVRFANSGASLTKTKTLPACPRA